MFKLNDFFHLPQIDPYFDRIIAEGPGIIIIAGIESHPTAPLAGYEENRPGEYFLPSGMSALFDVLVQAILSADSTSQAVVVAREKSLARAPRQLKRRIKLFPVEGGQSYDRQIHNAVLSKPALLVVDHLTVESAAAVFRAAREGLKVIVSFDTALHGSGLVRQLLDLGIQADELGALTWVLSMQRLPALCTHCRRRVDVQKDMLDHLCQERPNLAPIVRELFYEPGMARNGADVMRSDIHLWRAAGCSQCHMTGRLGDVTIFDVYDARAGFTGLDSLYRCTSLLSFDEYVLRLACLGYLDPDDLLWLGKDQLRRTYNLLFASGQALSEASSTLNRKLFELEASNRVLVQRTEVLMSLEDLGQALIESVDLHGLAKRVCRRAGDLCGADRVILYLLRGEDGANQAKVLAVHGWEGAKIEAQLDAALICEPAANIKSQRYIQVPPGVTMKPRKENGEAVAPLQAGLRVPLKSQDRTMGAMIIQSTQKGFFTPGETALLQTFANQAALAIQRAGLVDDLRGKIAELEEAQVQLVKKERMERELELARQVQQSLLPKVFPQIAGFSLAARNQPARQVGGDFYDVIMLDEDHFGIVMADVSDKGMPAALYMGLSRSLILAEAHREYSPVKALRSVNNLLLELGDLNGFVSVFYGVVQISTRRMRYSRAGHERPWLVHSHSSTANIHMQRLPGDGTVLGVIEAELLHLSEEEIELACGDCLVLYTDGLSDLTNARGDFFGGESLGILIDRMVKPERDADGICDAIFKELTDYRGGADQFDDMTLMVLQVSA